MAWNCGCGNFGWQWRGYVLSDQPIVFFNRCTGLSLCDWTIINANAFGMLFFVKCVAILKYLLPFGWTRTYNLGLQTKSASLFWMGKLRILKSVKYLIFIDTINSDCYIIFRSENIRFVTNTTCSKNQYHKEFQARLFAKILISLKIISKKQSTGAQEKQLR